MAAVHGAVLAILLFFSFFDNFAQMPLVAPYAAALGADPVWIGMIVASYSLTNLLGNLGAGYVLDRWGRKIPLALGMIWAGTSVLLYAVVATPWQLLVVRGLHGLGGAVTVPAIFTMAGDRYSGRGTARSMGRIGAVIGLAAIVGPMYSGIVRERWGYIAVFAGVFVALLVGGILAFQRLPETHKAQPAKRLPPFRVKPPLVIASLGSLVLTATLGALTLLLPLHTEALALPPSRTGAVFSVFAIAAVFVMLLRREPGPLRLAGGFGAITMALGILALGGTFAVIAGAMVVYGLGFGLLYPTFNTTVATSYGPEERGRAFGVFYACFSVGIVFAPPLAGIVSADWGFQTTYLIVAIPALLAATVLPWAAHRAGSA